MSLFAQRGFEQPTMDEVAEAAGVRKATLYSYFDGRSALIDAVIDTWLHDLPTLRPTNGTLPLRRQLIDVGLQLQDLAAHPAAASLTLAGQRLSAEQQAAWRRRYEEFERFLSGLLERHRCCEQPRQVAQAFLLLVIGDLRPKFAAPRTVVDTPRVAQAVDLLLRAYPQRCSSGDC